MGLDKNFLLTMSHWTEYLLLYILVFYIYKICKQWDLLNCKNSTMSHWKKSLFTFLFKLKIDSCKQWDLLKTSFLTMSHWPILVTVYKYLSYFHMCKQWDLNPHSFTLLFPKNSLSTNFNMLT